MSKLQGILITLLFAVLLPVAGALRDLNADDLVDWRSWMVGLLIGVGNALGVALIALFTQGGITLARK